jgi:hypothetical protein
VLYIYILKVGLRETVGGILIFECLAPGDGNCTHLSGFSISLCFRVASFRVKKTCRRISFIVSS